MHLNFGYFVLYTPIYRLTKRKKTFHEQNRPCETLDAKICYVTGLLVHGKVVVEFGRKVFLVNCLLWKTLNMANIVIAERAQVFYATKL